MVHAKGYHMAFGHTKDKADTTKGSVTPSAKTVESVDNSDFKLQPLILSAFIAIVLGLLVSLAGFRYSRYISFVLAFTAVGLFIYYYLDYKNQLDIKDDPKDPMTAKIKIQVDFLYGYWLSLAFSGIAALAAIIPFGNSKNLQTDSLLVEPFPGQEENETDSTIPNS